MSGCGGPAVTPVCCHRCFLRLDDAFHPTGHDVGFQRWATTWARILDHCADMNGAPLTRTPPRRSWGRGPPPPGWRRIQARRSTCLLLRAVQRRRVESLVLGALSSSPVHRALVLVLGTNIAVLLDCSKSSRQCSLSYLLTYVTYVLFLLNLMLSQVDHGRILH